VTEEVVLSKASLKSIIVNEMLRLGVVSLVGYDQNDEGTPLVGRNHELHHNVLTVDNMLRGWCNEMAGIPLSAIPSPEVFGSLEQNDISELDRGGRNRLTFNIQSQTVVHRELFVKILTR